MSPLFGAVGAGLCVDGSETSDSFNPGVPAGGGEGAGGDFVVWSRGIQRSGPGLSAGA